jgi:hypothetical protein
MAFHNISCPSVFQDWTLSKNKRVYFDSSKNSYVSSIITAHEVIKDENLGSTSAEYYRDFIIDVLEEVAKDYDDKIIDDLVLKVSLLSHYIDPSPYIKEKILLGIAESEIGDLPDKKLSTTDIENTTETIFSVSTFFTRIESVANKFIEYQKSYIINLHKGSGIVYSNLDFQMESEKLYKFRKSLNDLIDANGINISEYDTLNMVFDENFIPIRILLSSVSIENEPLTKQFKDFGNSDPQNRNITMFFVYNLSNLEKDTKRNNFTYQDIIDSYFFIKPKISTSNINIIKRADNSGAAYSVSNSDTTKKFDSLSNISQRSIPLLKDEILSSVSNSPCLTPEDRKKLNEKLERESEKKATFAQQYTMAVQDTFFVSLPEVLQKVAKKQGDEALQELGKSFLNRLGLCGIGDLTSLVVNTVFSYLKPQEYADELSKCAIKNLKNENLSKLEIELIRLGKNTEVLERYRGFVGDTIPPWKTAGYVPPDYYKDLETDDPIIEAYTFKIGGAVDDTEIDFRFSAYKDSIVASVNAQDLLNTLTNVFPDEMGWLSFFTDLTKSILDKCKAPKLHAQSGATANWCQGRFQLPKLKELPIAVSGLTPKASVITGIIVEEVKSLIITLTVKLIVATMNQLFQIISAGVSGDTNYFKENEYIPDFFQNEDYLQNAILSKSGKSKKNADNINKAVKEVAQNNSPGISIEIDNEEVDKFLKAISIALGEYEKIKLLKGVAGDTTFQKVEGLLESGDFPGLRQILKNYGDIEAFFLELGKMIDISSLEKAYFDGLYKSQGSFSFCEDEDFDSLSQAYSLNKPGITDEQIEKMKETLKDIQRDKICFAVDMIGDPSGPIIGKISEILSDKNGPVHKKMNEQQAEYHNLVVENTVNTLKELYYADLFNYLGLLDLILSVNGNSYGNTIAMINNLVLSLRAFPGATIGTLSPDKLEEEAKSKIKVLLIYKKQLELSEADYNPSLNKTNIEVNYDGKSISYLDNGTIRIKSGTTSILDIKSKETTDSFEPGSQKIADLLSDSLSFLSEADRSTIIINYINDIQPSNIKKYYSEIRDNLENKGWFYLGWKKDRGIYDTLNNSKDLIPLLLGSPNTSAKDLYKKLDEPVPIKNIFKAKKIPFNDRLTKSETVQRYLYFNLIVRVIISEMCWKATEMFETYSPTLFSEGDIISSYIYEKLIQNMDEYGFGSDKNKLSFFEDMTQVYLKSLEAEAYEIKNSNTLQSIDNINDQIASWIKGQTTNDRIDFLTDLEGDMKIVITDMIENILEDCIESFQLGLRATEGFTRPIPAYSSIKNYVLENSSLMGDLKDVFPDVNDIGKVSLSSDFVGVRLEKYIKIFYKDGTESVKKLEDFQKTIADTSLNGDISDFYDSWKFGIRISLIGLYDLLGVSSDLFSLEDRDSEKAFLLKSSDPVFNFYLFPLVNYEKQIDDQKISSSIINGYNNEEMIDSLSKTDKFNNFYYKGMNIENLLSLNTIYTNENFSDLLETGDDIRKWKALDLNNRSGKAFINSKKYLFKSLKKEL